MRIDLTYLKQYLPCFFVILLVEGFCALLLWLSDIRLFLSLILLMLLFSIFVFFVLGFLFYRKEKNKEAALIAFLSEPGIETELRLKSAFASNKEMIRALTSSSLIKTSSSTTKIRFNPIPSLPHNIFPSIYHQVQREASSEARLCRVIRLNRKFPND